MKKVERTEINWLISRLVNTDTTDKHTLINSINEVSSKFEQYRIDKTYFSGITNPHLYAIALYTYPDDNNFITLQEDMKKLPRFYQYIESTGVLNTLARNIMEHSNTNHDLITNPAYLLFPLKEVLQIEYLIPRINTETLFETMSVINPEIVSHKCFLIFHCLILSNHHYFNSVNPKNYLQAASKCTDFKEYLYNVVYKLYKKNVNFMSTHQYSTSVVLHIKATLKNSSKNVLLDELLKQSSTLVSDNLPNLFNLLELICLDSSGKLISEDSYTLNNTLKLAISMSQTNLERKSIMIGLVHNENLCKLYDKYNLTVGTFVEILANQRFNKLEYFHSMDTQFPAIYTSILPILDKLYRYYRLSHINFRFECTNRINLTKNIKCLRGIYEKNMLYEASRIFAIANASWDILKNTSPYKFKSTEKSKRTIKLFTEAAQYVCENDKLKLPPEDAPNLLWIDKLLNAYAIKYKLKPITFTEIFNNLSFYKILLSSDLRRHVLTTNDFIKINVKWLTSNNFKLTLPVAYFIIPPTLFQYIIKTNQINAFEKYVLDYLEKINANLSYNKERESLIILYYDLLVGIENRVFKTQKQEALEKLYRIICNPDKTANPILEFYRNFFLSSPLADMLNPTAPITQNVCDFISQTTLISVPARSAIYDELIKNTYIDIKSAKKLEVFYCLFSRDNYLTHSQVDDSIKKLNYLIHLGVTKSSEIVKAIEKVEKLPDDAFQNSHLNLVNLILEMERLRLPTTLLHV